MGTDIAAQAAANSAVALSGLKTAAVKTKQELPQTGQVDFLRLLKSGKWVYGQNDLRVQEGSIWAIDPLTYKVGWICWTDFPEGQKNKMLNKVMVPLGRDVPRQEELKQYFDGADEHNNGDPWPYVSALSVELTCVTGEDKGKKVLYEASSKGGLNLLSAYLDKMVAMIDEGTPVALVQLDHDSYKHPSYGETLTPEFIYVEWRALDDGNAVAEPEPEQVEEQAKVRERPRAAGPDKAEDTVTAGSEADDAGGDPPAPTRRRRRPAA